MKLACTCDRPGGRAGSVSVCRFIGRPRESSNNPIRPFLGQIDYPRYELAEVGNDGGCIPRVVIPGEQECVRRHERNRDNGYAKGINQYIVFRRGSVIKVLDRLNKSLIEGVPAEKLAGQCSLLLGLRDVTCGVEGAGLEKVMPAVRGLVVSHQS